MDVKKLIEVALPIREISTESARDKSLRHGHISTLHLWWARRPLAACRGIVFASLVPDPDDENCPKSFRDLVTRLLKDRVPSALKAYRHGTDWVQDTDPYKPYEGIPDTPRNRLLAFVAKWSPEKLAFDAGKREKKPNPDGLLDDRSLVKWETSDPENPQGREILRIARELVVHANKGCVPTLLDPFAGGGAIPLEATRLGCQSIANDYNPVAYLLLRVTCEFPQRYGSGLVKDVERWSNWLLNHAETSIGKFFPPGADGKTVVAYIWARTAPCSNPACRKQIPLLRSLLICNKPGKKIALTMNRRSGEIVFGIAKGKEIQREEGTMIEKGRGSVSCSICRQTTPVDDLRRAGMEGKLGEQMVAVVTLTSTGKDYRPVERTDFEAFEKAQKMSESVEPPSEPILPEITGNDERVSNSTGIRVHLYGMKTWGSLFNPRQLLVMQTLVDAIKAAMKEMQKTEADKDYCVAVSSYLGCLVDRIAQRGGRASIWNTQGENIEHPFSLAKISMTWDYPEMNPFSDSTGGAKGALNWIQRVIKHEAATENSKLLPTQVHRGDGSHLRIEDASVDVVVTDPPYFDEISYADLSDYFYVWLKRGLGEFYSEPFATPLTPKEDEATALKHRHGGNSEKAEKHFTSKLAACFAEAKRVCKPDSVVAVMFAHQSTEAWTSLIHALFDAGLNITATYPIQTERANRPRELNSSALGSSITVMCRLRTTGAATSFKDVRREIETVVGESIHRFWDYGFRGADLIVACYGPAVGVFGRYERVERGDGSPVRVPELLEVARQSALKAIAGEFQGDELSRLYFVWANQYGASEQSYDDLVKVAQMGVEDENAANIAGQRGLFVVNGSSCRLALLGDRIDRRHLGEESAAPLIDILHHAMHLWKTEKRGELIEHLAQHDLTDDPAFWKLTQALFEVLPRGEEDWKIISALLGERETLKTEIRRVPKGELL